MTGRTALIPLAGEAGVKRKRVVLAATGVTPRQWLNEVRLNKALDLLLEGKSVKEVLDELSFKQRSHFSRAFRNFHGFTASKLSIHSLFTKMSPPPGRP
jgi:AraC-like DNA-binding protein